MGLDQLFHRAADVVAWGQVGGADEVIRQRAVEQNLGLALDERLELRLPLLGSAITGRGQQRQQFFRTSGAAQDLVEAAVGGDAIAAFTGQDERAARLEDSCAGAHAFNGLIQVLIDRDSHFFAAPCVPLLEEHVGYIVAARFHDQSLDLPYLAVGRTDGQFAAYVYLAEWDGVDGDFLRGFRSARAAVGPDLDRTGNPENSGGQRKKVHARGGVGLLRSEEHTSELQSLRHLVC